VGVFVGVCVCVLWVCYHDNSKLRVSIFTKLGLYVESSDHLQLIKFWPSCAPGNGVCGGAKFFGSALLQPARSVCVSPSAFFHLAIFCVSAKLGGMCTLCVITLTVTLTPDP